jgi:hypothetical protein
MYLYKGILDLRFQYTLLCKLQSREILLFLERKKEKKFLNLIFIAEDKHSKFFYINFKENKIFSDCTISIFSIRIKIYLMGTMTCHKIFTCLIQVYRLTHQAILSNILK